MRSLAESPLARVGVLVRVCRRAAALTVAIIRFFVACRQSQALEVIWEKLLEVTVFESRKGHDNNGAVDISQSSFDGGVGSHARAGIESTDGIVAAPIQRVQRTESSEVKSLDARLVCNTSPESSRCAMRIIIPAREPLLRISSEADYDDIRRHIYEEDVTDEDAVSE